MAVWSVRKGRITAVSIALFVICLFIFGSLRSAPTVQEFPPPIDEDENKLAQALHAAEQSLQNAKKEIETLRQSNQLQEALIHDLRSKEVLDANDALKPVSQRGGGGGAVLDKTQHIQADREEKPPRSPIKRASLEGECMSMSSQSLLEADITVHLCAHSLVKTSVY